MIHMCFIMFIVTWFILWTNLIDNIRDVWKITWKYYSLLPQEGTSKKSWIFKIAQGWHHHTHLGLFTGTLYNNNQKRKKLLQTFWGWRILVSYSAGLVWRMVNARLCKLHMWRFSEVFHETWTRRCRSGIYNITKVWRVLQVRSFRGQGGKRSLEEITQEISTKKDANRSIVPVLISSLSSPPTPNERSS